MTIEQLFSTGLVADLVLVVMALEAAVLLYVMRHEAKSQLVGLLGNLAAGAFLVGALRIALTGGDWKFIALALIGSLIGHGIDVSQRLGSRWRD